MKDTGIEWADSTWNPWRGCTKVSAGCANCYAETLSKRNPGLLGQWGKGKPRVLAKNWNDPVKWNRNAAEDLRCVVCGATRFNDAVNADGYCAQCELEAYPHRPRVFPSLCDWLDEEVPLAWLVRFLRLIHDTPNINWLLLTKRPSQWYNRLFSALLEAESITHPNLAECDPETTVGVMLNDWLAGRPPSNVWIGASVEDQGNADRRILELLKIPARLRFLSLEPLLGPVDLKLMGRSFGFPKHITKEGHAVGMPQGIHWAIVGGESGPGARPCDIGWIRDIVRQCAAAKVPCFVKQLGVKPFAVRNNAFTDHGFADKIMHPKGGDPAEWPEDLRVRQMPEVKP